MSPSQICPVDPSAACCRQAYASTPGVGRTSALIPQSREKALFLASPSDFGDSRAWSRARRRELRVQAQKSQAVGQALRKSSKGKLPPWAFGFQMNERYLNWDTAAQAQLLKLACADKLGLTLAELEARITDVSALIPDLPNKLGRMKAEVLCSLIEDPEKLAHRLSVLRELMPTTNVSKLVSSLPAIILDYEPESLAARLDILRAAFGSRTDVEFLVVREPNLVKVATSKEAVEKLISNVKRLLPIEDAVSFVISNPGMVLDMDTGNLPSAIDGDLTQGG